MNVITCARIESPTMLDFAECWQTFKKSGPPKCKLDAKRRQDSLMLREVDVAGIKANYIEKNGYYMPPINQRSDRRYEYAIPTSTLLLND